MSTAIRRNLGPQPTEKEKEREREIETVKEYTNITASFKSRFLFATDGPMGRIYGPRT